MDIVNVITDTDIDRAVVLINNAFSTVARQFGFTRETVPSFPAFIDSSVIRRQVENGLHLYAYKNNDRFIGSVGYKKNGEDYYLVERLAVDPAYRHNGTGTSLMNFISSKIAECGGRIIEVQIVNENVPLRTWYLEQGFSEVRVDTYTHLPFTIGVLQKELTSSLY